MPVRDADGTYFSKSRRDPMTVEERPTSPPIVSTEIAAQQTPG